MTCEVFLCADTAAYRARVRLSLGNNWTYELCEPHVTGERPLSGVILSTERLPE